MYETYPKKGQRMLGEQTGKKFAPDGAKPEYQQVGSKDRYPAKGHHGPLSRHASSEKARKPFLSAGGNKQVSATYPAKTHAKFGTEKAANKLREPMNCSVKKA
jgi:hypothetical protein